MTEIWRVGKNLSLTYKQKHLKYVNFVVCWVYFLSSNELIDLIQRFILYTTTARINIITSSLGLRLQMFSSYYNIEWLILFQNCVCISINEYRFPEHAIITSREEIPKVRNRRYLLNTLSQQTISNESL